MDLRSGLDFTCQPFKMHTQLSIERNLPQTRMLRKGNYDSVKSENWFLLPSKTWLQKKGQAILEGYSPPPIPLISTIILERCMYEVGTTKCFKVLLSTSKPWPWNICCGAIAALAVAVWPWACKWLCQCAFCFVQLLLSSSHICLYFPPWNIIFRVMLGLLVH